MKPNCLILLAACAVTVSCDGNHGYPSRQAYMNAVAEAQVRAMAPNIERTPEEEAKLKAEAEFRDKLIAKWAKERSPVDQAILDARLDAWREGHQADKELRDACMTAMVGDLDGIVACGKL